VSPGRVTLLTDFGTADGYAAAMAGVIAAVAPAALVEHASHEIPPGDIGAAALALSRYAFLYPPGTVHLVVVDPGVGTDRRALAARIDGRFFVAPDNGVLTRVLEPRPGETGVAGATGATGATGAALVELVELVELDPGRLDLTEPLSDTFHGRDLFAPAAARLARGDALEFLGHAFSGNPALLPWPRPERSDARIIGAVIQVDRFGNLITNIAASWLVGAGSGTRVEVEGVSAGELRRTYGDVAPGELLALRGSLGLLEVSVRDGSAADRLEAGRGARVTVALSGD